MKWVKTSHERGGLLTAGSDEGGIGGIALIRELELLQEAGIHPIDVIKVATTNAYQALGMEALRHPRRLRGRPGGRERQPDRQLQGDVRPRLRLLRPRAARRAVEAGGVEWTIKDGVLFDAQALLREAEWYVQETKRKPATTAAKQSRQSRIAHR